MPVLPVQIIVPMLHASKCNAAPYVAAAQSRAGRPGLCTVHVVTGVNAFVSCSIYRGGVQRIHLVKCVSTRQNALCATILYKL